MDGHLLRFDKAKTLVLVDVETFNVCLNFKRNLPWQVSMLKAKGDNKIDERDFYIKWKTKLKCSEEAARINHYNPATLEQLGVSPEEAFLTIEEWLESADYIIGHNVLGFDFYLLKEMYKFFGKRANHLINKFIDTNCLAKGFKMNVPFKQGENLLEYQYKLYHTRVKGIKTNLALMAREFEIDHDPDKMHNSLYDLAVNLQVWNVLKYKIDI